MLQQVREIVMSALSLHIVRNFEEKSSKHSNLKHQQKPVMLTKNNNIWHVLASR